MFCFNCKEETEFDLHYQGYAGSGLQCMMCLCIEHVRTKYTPRLPTGKFWTDKEYKVISKVEKGW